MLDEHELLTDPDPPPPAEDGSTGCPGRCEHGWKAVSESFVEQEAAALAPVGSKDHVRLLAAFRNTVYPCRVCRRSAFYRWVNKHWERDHDPAACVECQEARSGRRGPRRSRGSMVEQYRRDLE